MDIQWLLDMSDQAKGASQSSTDTLALRDGDRLTASVLEVLKGRDALIAFGRFRAYARLPLPVVTGQTIEIRLEQAETGLCMRMLPDGFAQSDAKPDEALTIRLFEPVSDQLSLPAHSRSLVSGDSLSGRITGFEKDGLLLVDFGKFKAFAKIDIPVRRGQILPLSVVKTDQGIAFTVDTRTPAAPFPDASAATAAHMVRADRGGGGMDRSPLIDTSARPESSAAPAVASREGETRIAALSTPPTAPEMVQLRGQIQHLLDQSGLPGKTATASLSPTTQTALLNIQQLLRPASPNGNEAALMARIRDFVENSGIYFEKRLETAIRELQDRPRPMTPDELARQPAIRDLMVKDLKPNLLILNDMLDSQLKDRQADDRHIVETMKSVVQRALAHMEKQQIAATEKPVDPSLLQAFSHLLLLADNRHDARLKVYYAKKGRDDARKTPRVALLLEMDRMGPVRTDLWMVGKDLNITFFVRSEDAKAAIDGARDQIRTALDERFNTIAVSTVVNAKKIAQFDGEDLDVSPRGRVDLSI